MSAKVKWPVPAVLLTALLMASCATPWVESGEDEDVPLTAVGYVDLNRYMGRWYLIANIPYFAERGNLAPYVEYSLRKDGVIDDRYTALSGFDQEPFVKNGYIEILNPITNAEGRITFLPPIWQEYSVLYLDDDYKYSMIGHPTRNYCWVFSREPSMPDEIYHAMLAVLAANRFDTRRVLRIPHHPEQLGLPGYQ